MRKEKLGSAFFNIEHFVKSYTKVESKTLLWRLFKLSILDKRNAMPKDELKDLAVFYEKLNKVLDDIY